jgi:predicted metal-dependent RNase
MKSRGHQVAGACSRLARPRLHLLIPIHSPNLTIRNASHWQELSPSAFAVFGFEDLELIRSVKKSKKLNESSEQSIIISASSICEAGRILHHLKNNIVDPNNTILFVGYSAQNTLGWKIRHREPTVKIFGAPL